MGTLLMRNRLLLGAYNSLVPRGLGWSWGGGRFLMGEVPQCTNAQMPPKRSTLIHPTDRRDVACGKETCTWEKCSPTLPIFLAPSLPLSPPPLPLSGVQFSKKEGWDNPRRASRGTWARGKISIRLYTCVSAWIKDGRRCLKLT